MSKCPSCGQEVNSAEARLIKDSCGHTKCRMCLLYEEHGCKACNSISTNCSTGTFDYTSPSTKESLQDPEKDESDPSRNYCNNSSVISEELVKKDSGIEFNEDALKVESSNDSEKIKTEKIDEPEHPNISEEIIKNSCQKLEDTSKKKRFSDWSHIVTIPSNPETYKCNVCKKVFRNKKGKLYHNGCATGIYPYKCTVCDKSFVKRSHYEYHERMHTGYKPFKCDICNKAFPQQGKLNRHMGTHNEGKALVCQVCGKRFCKNEYLQAHLSTHSESTPYVCKFCPKAFRIASNLTRHLKTHSSERPHKCDKCGKTFKDRSLLVRHEKTHEKDRPFGCDNCSRVFLSKSELKRHMTVHSEEKPFSCQFCHTDFRRKDNLNRHIRHHHMEDPNKEIQPELPKIKTKPVEKVKRVPKPKPKQKSCSSSGQKSVSKASIAGINSQRQIISRLDSMGNITPVIRTIGEVSNAVPVINGPISIKKLPESTERKKTFTYIEPIPVAEAVDINRRIQEKLYPQNSPNRNYYFCVYSPTERNNEETVNRVSTIQTVVSTHWRRRTAETLKKR